MVVASPYSRSSHVEIKSPSRFMPASAMTKVISAQEYQRTFE